MTALRSSYRGLTASFEQSELAPLMIPYLTRLQAHEASPGLIRKRPELDHRVICGMSR